MTTFRLRRSTTLAALAFVLAAPAWAQQYAVSTYAGGAWPLLPAAGPSVPVGYPRAVVPDGHGSVYFTSTGRNGIFKLDAAGTLTVVAGNGMPSSWPRNGPATGAFMGPPQGLAVDAFGRVAVGAGCTGTLHASDDHA